MNERMVVCLHCLNVNLHQLFYLQIVIVTRQCIALQFNWKQYPMNICLSRIEVRVLQYTWFRILDTPVFTVHMIQDTPASTIWWCSQPRSAKIPGNHKLINIVQCSLWTKFTSSPAPTPWRRPGRQDTVFYSGGNFCNLMGPWGVSAVENVKLKCRAAEYPSTGSLYLMEQRSV